MEGINDSNDLPSNETKSVTNLKDIESQPNVEPMVTEPTISADTSETVAPNKPIEAIVGQLNGTLDETVDQTVNQSNEKTTDEDVLNEKESKTDKTSDEGLPNTEELVNGSNVTPKKTRRKRNGTQLTPKTPIQEKSGDNQNETNSEQRLTRSRYGRLQKAKTPNPEMITYDVKRRSSLKSNEASEDLSSESPVKPETNSLNDSVTSLRKSKRKISVPLQESGRKRKSNKLDSVINQIKTNTNETESPTRPPPKSHSPPKKRSNTKDNESVPQKKCIELTGDPASAIVDRNVLTAIPPQEGDYSVGDLIWAKVSGYPWWPCMVSLDPITALYSKISGMSYKAGRVYHVQYFGPQALRGWTSVGQVMTFEGREKYLQKLEAIKESSPKAQSAKIVAKYAIKPSAKKQWDQSVDEAEEAAKMTSQDRVKALTFEYTLSTKASLRRKSESLEGEQDVKRKKLTASPEDIYDFDDNEDAVNISQSTPGLMWRKRVQKGDFATYFDRYYDSVAKENPGASKQDIEDMLQKRWDLLGDDLRQLYTDRRFGQINENESDLFSTPKALNTNSVSKSNTKRKTSSKKSKVKQNSLKKSEEIDSNESDSEGNLVIAETPTKKAPTPKTPKSSSRPGRPPAIAPTPKAANSAKKPEPKSLQKKISPKKPVAKTPKSKKSIESTKEVNGVQEKSQNTEQSLVAFGIDYLDEFASSEDTSSTSEPEAVDGVKTGLEKICVVCNESEDSDSLISCQGTCLQMFHKKCAKYEGIDSQFKCVECETGKHKCFICKNVEDKDQKETQKCNDSKCGKYYHISCLQKEYPVKMNDQKDSFLCPLHFCLNCHIESQNDKDFRPSRRRLVKCIFCPTAYHLGDYCIAAGTVLVSQNFVICPDHYEKKKKDRHVNVNYCFSCLTGGQLICCESCPAAFHTTCLDYPLDPDSNFYCVDCTARKPLHYGDIIWVKLGCYRWWPGRVCHPKQVPDNVMKLAHTVGEFPVYFFGSHDYYWVQRGRVFMYVEGDNKVVAANSGKKCNKTFKLATEEAAENFKAWEESKIAIRKAMVVNKPPPYTHIRSNKPIGPKVQITNSDESQTLCECKVKNNESCNDENCINRALMVECDPRLCPAGDLCKNQKFKKREYVLAKPFKTESAGWGLRALEDIKKGQFVVEYVGELIDEEECERRLKQMGDNNQSNFYFLTIDKDTIIDAGPKGNLARFMNHSCQPNCETQKWMVNGATRVGLFAICDIPSETELTFNYNLDCRGNEKTRCDCHSPNCSGFIGVRPNKVDDTLNRKSAANGQSGRKKKKKTESFSKMHDDICFSCGEGGDLIMCDRKGCPKSYHLECLKLAQIPKGKWECPRHFCDTCGKGATALCAYCPNSLCKEHAVPSKLTQLPDGGLLCSDHSNQEINGILMESEDKVEDVEEVRKESDETTVATEEEPKESLVLETSSNVENSESMDTTNTPNVSQESVVNL